MDLSIIQFMSNITKENDEKIINAARLHLLLLPNKIRCNLVKVAFNDKQTRLKTFKILEELLGWDEDVFNYDFDDKYIIYKLVILFLYNEGKDYKEYFKNKIQEVNESFFNQDKTYLENQLIKDCKINKCIFEGTNEIWNFLKN